MTLSWTNEALMLFSTQKVSSASQMTAARAMGVIARQLDCAGHAADEVSASTPE